MLTGTNVMDELDALAELVVAMMPGCVGVSLTMVVDGEAFTLTSTSEGASLLDAAQYLDDEGPCLQAAASGQRTAVADVLDEQRWQTFRLTAPAVGVRSSLSLPIPGPGGDVAGAVNVYSSRPDAFRESAEVLAAALQVPMNAVVANADLTFATREYARQFPERVEAKLRTDVAVGLLMELRGWRAEEARTRLRDSAAEAGLPIEKVADLIVSVYGER